jgi:hypothetical protein
MWSYSRGSHNVTLLCSFVTHCTYLRDSQLSYLVAPWALIVGFTLSALNWALVLLSGLFVSTAWTQSRQ